MARLAWACSAFAQSGQMRLSLIPLNKYLLLSLDKKKNLLLIKNKYDHILVRKVFALSSFLCRSSRVNQVCPAARPTIPIFLSWGTRDSLVQHAWMEATRQMLTKTGLTVECLTRDMDHEMDRQQIAALMNWIKS